MSRKDRSRAQFERFAAESAADLTRTAYLIVWDLGEAEDLVQECLLRVARRWPRVRRMEHPAAYARRILVNLALDGAVRRTRRRSELELEPGEELGVRAAEPLADGLALVDPKSELIVALGRLPARQRAVLVLRYFADLSDAQIAAALGCSVGTVKSTASRGLTRLREALDAVRAEAANGASPSFEQQRSSDHERATRR